MAFDELDERIVVALVDNARATYAEIGSSVGLSAPAVKRRVDRLRASGAITGFSARVDPSAMGWTTEAYVELFCRGRTSPAGIAAEVGKDPEVFAAASAETAPPWSMRAPGKRVALLAAAVIAAAVILGIAAIIVVNM